VLWKSRPAAFIVETAVNQFLISAVVLVVCAIGFRPEVPVFPWCFYKNPIPRPPIATPSHKTIDTIAAIALQARLLCASSALVTLR